MKSYTIYQMVHFQWPWMISDPDFNVTTFFEVDYRKRQRHLKDKVTIPQTETIPNIWNGTMFGDLDWPINASRGFVSISWTSCLICSTFTPWVYTTEGTNNNNNNNNHHHHHHRASCPQRHYLTCVCLSQMSRTSGLFHSDGKRPDGLTLIPWQRGLSLTWNVTVPTTLADSSASASSAGAAAGMAASRKQAKYATLSGFAHVPAWGELCCWRAKEQ